MYIASIFVEVPCILPDQGNFIVERSPGLEIRYTGRIVATFDSTHPLLQALQAYRFLYYSVVLL